MSSLSSLDMDSVPESDDAEGRGARQGVVGAIVSSLQVPVASAEGALWTSISMAGTGEPTRVSAV